MNVVRRLYPLLLLLGLSTLPLSSEAGTPTSRPPPARLRIAYAAPIGVMAPIWMAAESGALRAEGLEVELILVEARAAIAALIAKEIDALEISAPGIIPAAIAGGDITMIAGLLNKMIFSYHAHKDIKSAEQLRGKVVGSDRVGTASDYGSRMSMSLLGLKPESNVSVLRIGGSNLLWPALQTGQIVAAPLTPPQSFSADALGFNRLVTTYHLPYQNVGIVVRKSDIDAKSDVWGRLVRATREGIRRWYGDPRLARDVLTKYTKERDPERLQKTYEFFTKTSRFQRGSDGDGARYSADIELPRLHRASGRQERVPQADLRYAHLRQNTPVTARPTSFASKGKREHSTFPCQTTFDEAESRYG